MKAGLAVVLLACAFVGLAVTPSHAQTQRSDVIWARTASSPITLDGKLDEPDWAKADSITIKYRQDNSLLTYIPGSGWKEEGGVLAGNPTNATVKFLVYGNQFYMGATVRDSSIGGSVDFNRFDGLLMGIKDHAATGFPKPVIELFYSWWCPDDTVHARDIGKQPVFNSGRWGNGTSTQTPAQAAAWTIASVVHGLANSDTLADTSWVVEMRLNLDSLGYNVTTPAGDIVEFNLAIYDCDYYWPQYIPKFSSNRTWIESPWGNTDWYDELRIHASSSVTVNSGPAPVIGPDLVIPNASGYASPVIDGKLTDAVWASAPKFDIRWGDDALRATYPDVARWRSGQFEATVNGGQAAVLDPADATVRYFFKGDSLFMGFDVRDKVVQYVSANVDRWDGFIVSIDDRGSRNPDHVLWPRRLTFQVGATGAAVPQDYLANLTDTLHGAWVALALKGGTTVDTLGTSPDSGYTAELKIDLTKLGYAHGLGDGLLFLGVDLLDGDSFTPFTLSYGTRTWWGHQYEGTSAPVWCYMDPSTLVPTGVGDGPDVRSLALRGNYPNPFGKSTSIRYSLSEPSQVSLEVFDVQGRRVARQALGLQPAGEHETPFSRTGKSAGLYFYRLHVTDPRTGAARATFSGKMTLLN